MFVPFNRFIFEQTSCSILLLLLWRMQTSKNSGLKIVWDRVKFHLTRWYLGVSFDILCRHKGSAKESLQQ